MRRWRGAACEGQPKWRAFAVPRLRSARLPRSRKNGSQHFFHHPALYRNTGPSPPASRLRPFYVDRSTAHRAVGSSPPPHAADCYSPRRLVQPSAGGEPQPTAQQPTAVPFYSARPIPRPRPPSPLLLPPTSSLSPARAHAIFYCRQSQSRRSRYTRTCSTSTHFALPDSPRPLRTVNACNILLHSHSIHPAAPPPLLAMQYIIVPPPSVCKLILYNFVRLSS